MRRGSPGPEQLTEPSTARLNAPRPRASIDGVTARAAAQYILVATRDGAKGFERGSHEGSYEFEFRQAEGTWKFSRQRIVTNNAHNPMFAA